MTQSSWPEYGSIYAELGYQVWEFKPLLPAVQKRSCLSEMTSEIGRGVFAEFRKEEAESRLPDKVERWFGAYPLPAAKAQTVFAFNDSSSIEQQCDYVDSRTIDLPDSTSVIYTGWLWNDRPHGQGSAIFVDGSKYEGQWVNGIKQGEGTLFYANGRRVTIQTPYPISAKREVSDAGAGRKGIAAELLPSRHPLQMEPRSQPKLKEEAEQSPRRHAGEWLNDPLHLPGVNTQGNQSIHKGVFNPRPDANVNLSKKRKQPVNNEGNQVLSMPSKRICSRTKRIIPPPATVNGDCRVYSKKYFLTDAAYLFYTGFTDKKLPHGQGIAAYDNGIIYHGEWKHGKKHGKGAVKVDKKTYTGIWKEDRAIKLLTNESVQNSYKREALSSEESDLKIINSLFRKAFLTDHETLY